MVRHRFTLPRWLLRPLAKWLIGRFVTGKTVPHERGNIHAQDGTLYMERGWIIRPSRWTFDWGARVHHTVRPDLDRALHDHPWRNISVLLSGWYDEELPGGYFVTRIPGDVVTRDAKDWHRLSAVESDGGCYSLFITGPYEQTWGFKTPAGKAPYKQYLGIEQGGMA